MPQNDTGHDVFISYSTKNQKTADALCQFLEERTIRCWIAPRNIPKGEEYEDVIVQAIEDAKFFVLVFSDCAQQSKWVKREVRRADAKDKIIIPFKIEDCQMEGGMILHLEGLQWVDAIPQPGEVLNEMAAAELADCILAQMTPVSTEQPDGDTEGNILPVPPSQSAAPADASNPESKESDWAALLAVQPQFADRRGWSGLNGRDWTMLLRGQPQFADRCNWKKLDGHDWAWLLREQPQFADLCNWKKLDVLDWSFLLKVQPQFANKCYLSHLEDLSGKGWQLLSGLLPQLFGKH